MPLSDYPLRFDVPDSSAGQRLDVFLTPHFPDAGRTLVQSHIGSGKVLLNGEATKASQKLRGGQSIVVLEPIQRAPLRAFAEEILLDIVYEDEQLAVVNKPAGMMVHAGAGATESARNRGTLVNALLHHFAALSEVGGELRPGIVHRLDRETSGLILVAKTDAAHRKLAAQFAKREVKKQYVALVHGRLKQSAGTIRTPIARDPVHRTRMTTRLETGRDAVTHYAVREAIESPFGPFSLVDVKIDTGRTHQIRVHLASVGHPVAGDTLYGAPEQLKQSSYAVVRVTARPTLARNFLHAARLEFVHPTTGERLRFEAALPSELEQFAASLRGSA